MSSAGARRRIAVVTVARSDYGILRPLLQALHEDAAFELQLIVAGNHRSPLFGRTISEIEADPWPIAEVVDMTLAADEPSAMAKGMGLGCIGLAQAYDRLRPDLIVVLGDRFEMIAAAAAATPFPIPIAHVAGGALSEGAKDDALRHAITKLSHLHFVELEAYRKRVLQMGEMPERVFLVGALAIDAIKVTPPIADEQLGRILGMPIDGRAPKPLLVTLHPVTQEPDSARRHIDNLLSALDAVDVPVVFTYPNADPEGQVIIDRINGYVQARRDAVAVRHVGAKVLYSFLRRARAMVGNSSSGIVEAASFRLPVVNIGTRQKNRIAPANVIHCGHDKADIVGALNQAVSQEFAHSLRDLANPYGDGNAAKRIMDTLRMLPEDAWGTVKRFHDLPAAGVTTKPA